MLPQNSLSPTPLPSDFLPPRDFVPKLLEDYEMGGVGLNDASKGLLVKIWKCAWVDGNFILSAPGVAPTTVYSAANVTEVALTFDQNMQPCLVYVQGDAAFLRWYDATIPGFAVLSLAAGAVTPKCALDDKRLLEGAKSDILVAYIRSNNLYVLTQRERFVTERLLATNIGNSVRRIGMSRTWRFQFDIGE